MATITSKRQLTLPASIYEEMGLKKGSKVTIEKTDGGIIIKPAQSLLERLAGSVSVQEVKKSVDIDTAITEAKKLRYKSS